MQSGMITKNLPFKVGQTMTVVGIPELDCPESRKSVLAAGFNLARDITPAICCRFQINIGSDEFTIGLHFNPRFDYGEDHNTVVCNSFQDLTWGEEVRGRNFPFRQGQEFKVIIDFTPTEFVVTLSDDSIINFPNRFGAKEYSVMNLQGKFRFTSLQIK
ncbi:beta-galactoside-binding lectin-like isoform X1 [Salarias fasciatus]|uniref:beta-galactoside-binding lectin-like isoform X1 n=1 Tax=Salarias fasciatus TaxID=181472 RepID=UPI001176D2CB|nr:beta-galactoside-binding lectin-like isoform X1 [Salarias fasciatus]